MKRNRLLHHGDDDPMQTVANLFDVAMVFAVALMVALVARFNMQEIFGKEDFTIIKNPGQDNMEIVVKQGKEINTYQATDQQADDNANLGRKVGTAYQMADGRIIYVPDNE